MAAENRRRVKVYSFNEGLQWEDMGTGHVIISYLERLQSPAIIVRSEEDGTLLLESKILPDRRYQKQEETLVVWTEDDTCDLAVSFQEKPGCDDLWSKLCEIQGRDPMVTVTQDMSEDGELSDLGLDDSSVTIELPPCELSRLDDISTTVQLALTSLPKKDLLVIAIEKEGYIQKLLELFHICEDLENTESLHQLYNIFRTFFLLNKASLLHIIFQDDIIDDVIGCLEYESMKPHPNKHREYIAKFAQHREVIPFNNPDLLAMIHQTYKVQYIQEVILPTPSLFEENMMAALNSFIMFNKTEIVNSLQADVRFLQRLFSELMDEATSESRFKELTQLLREVCAFSLALELEDRTNFIGTLSLQGFMTAIEMMLVCEDADIVATAVDILNSITEFNSSILRDHILQQSESSTEDNQFLNLILSLLVDGECTEIDVQLVGLIKAIIDSESITTESSSQTVEKSLFLNHFYEHSMHRLMAPLMAQTAVGDSISKDSAMNAVLLSYILDLLSLCVERHSYHIRNYIIDKNILARVLVLMTSCHSHLALAALRLCRKIVGLNDEFYNRYIVRYNLLAPVIRAFLANGRRYNLLNSAVIELFEHIKTQAIKSLMAYFVENFMSTLSEVEYVDTFQSLKLKYEQALELEENPPDATATCKIGILYGGTGDAAVSRFRRDPRQLDHDEESWFDEEEEVTSPIPYDVHLTKTTQTTPTATPTASSNTSSPFTMSSYSPRPLPAGSPRPLPAGSPRPLPAAKKPLLSKQKATPTFSAALYSLLEYDADEEDENGGEEPLNSSAKRQRLDNS